MVLRWLLHPIRSTLISRMTIRSRPYLIDDPIGEIAAAPADAWRLGELRLLLPRGMRLRFGDEAGIGHVDEHLFGALRGAFLVVRRREA